jgi:HAE1 family hydrophobic/amphiphilic exporter-1
MHFWARGAETPTATVVLAVYRQAGTNAVEVSKAVRELLPLVTTQLPKAVKLTPIYDRSRSIVNSVRDVEETLVIAFALVVLVIFFFLGRAADTLIPVIAMPLSLLITFIFMSFFNYSLDNLSLMALTLAIGFLVDDAIVFLENTVRRMEAGEDRLTATLNSAKEISFTILSMTLSLAAVFFPLIFMSGLLGRVFREFVVTIVVAIFASGIVSLTLTPLMCSRLLANRGHGHKKALMERLSDWVFRPIVRFYGWSLHFFLRHAWISALAGILCMVATVYYYTVVPKTFLPIGDSSFSLGVMIGQEGTSPQQMRQYQDQADQIMRANQDVAVQFSMTGNTNFLPSNYGLLLAFWEPPEKRAPIGPTTMNLMGQLSAVNGTFSGLRPMPVLSISAGATATLQGEFAYSISGIDPQETYDTGKKLIARLSDPKAFDGFASITSDLYDKTPNIEIEILRDQAATYGVSVEKIEDLLRHAYSQNYLYLIKRSEDQYQVIMEVKDSGRSRADDIGLLYVSSDDGKRQIPINAVVKWHETLGLQAVNHVNQFTSVTIFFNRKPGVPLGQATEFIEKTAAEVLPPAIRGGLRGDALEFQNATRTFVILLLMSVFVMYVILGILYESFLHPITVLTSLPVAAGGGLATLYYFNSELSLYAMIGLFMLMGIVKKNGIMMIDFALQRQAEGRSSLEAVHEASVERFRPIIMTTLAALMGAIPIALGYGADGESRRPLGLAIVGGLVISQILTLYITPVWYLFMEWIQLNILDRFSFFRAHHHMAAEAHKPPVSAGSARQKHTRSTGHALTEKE